MPTATSGTAASSESLTALDPVFAQMAAASHAACELPQLTDREKVFLRVVADTCQQSLGALFDRHVREGLARGISTADIRALLRLISYDSGYHAALGALARLAEIEAAAGIPRPQTELLPAELLQTGPGAPPSPLPEPVRAQLRQLDPRFVQYFDLQSRMRSGYGPGTLSVRERAFATMSIDVHYQTLEETFKIHIGRALGAGATHDDVRAVLLFNAPFGATRAWRAWKALNTHLAEAGPAT